MIVASLAFYLFATVAVISALNVFVRLRERIARARAANAELFVSIHADSMGSSETRGASVYTLSDTASDAETAAERTRPSRVLDQLESLHARRKLAFDDLDGRDLGV